MDMLGIQKKRSFTLGSREFTPQTPLIIAELGTGHGGSLAKAKELVDAAAQAGADCVKFQIVYADEILHPNTGVVPLPGGNIRLYDRFKALEMEERFYCDVKDYVESKGLLFLCTPFGIRSARVIHALGVKIMKIASPELNHEELLAEIASYGIPTLLSSGVSHLVDIESAIEHFSPSLLCLLHCVTAYPAPAEDYNLRVLPFMSGLLGVSVGVSDHSLDPLLVPTLACVCGATVVEKHFCLSRNDPGLDDPIALDPTNFTHMVKSLRRMSTQAAALILSELEDTYGNTLIEKVLGDGVKRLADSERANYERTNRSIHALRELAKGSIIGPDDIGILRTGKVLRPGMHPRWKNALIGRIVRQFIPAGEGIRFEDV